VEPRGEACQYRSMRASSRISLSLLALTATVALASGCVAESAPAPIEVPTSSAQPASPTPSPSLSRGPSATQVESQPRYDEAVANFPYELPSGYSFPEKVPAVGRLQEWVSGAKPAFQYWACATVGAAWDRADEGRRDDADALLRAIDDAKAAYPEYLSDFESRAIQWDSVNERTAGDSGLCSVWLDTLTDAS
jgi:hypothetical protein